MLNRLRDLLFSVSHEYPSRLSDQRARGLLVMLWCSAVVWLVWFATSGLPAMSASPNDVGVIGLPMLCVLVALIAAFILVQRGQLEHAGWLFTLVVTVIVLPPFFNQFRPDTLSMASPILLLLPLIPAGLLLSRSSLLGIMLVLLVALGVRTYLDVQSAARLTIVPIEVASSDAVIILTGLVFAFVVLQVFSGSAERLMNSMGSEARQMEAAGTYLNTVKDAPDETAILTRTLDVLREQLDYPNSQIFLLNEAGKPSRRVRAGLSRLEVGAAVTLRPGEESILTEAAVLKETVVITARDERRAHLVLPARSSAAIPVIYRQQVLGIMDVQSARDRFSEGELAALTLIADQLGVVLAQARALRDLERSVREQEEVSARFQSQLLELRESNQTVISNSWTRFLEGRGMSAFGFDLPTGGAAVPVAASNLPDHLRSALESGDVQVKQVDGERMVNVPIIFRGQTLGAMSFALPRDREVSERQLEMARTVSNRLGLALENTRLFEQTQAQAMRERKASEVANLLIGATDVRAVLNLAAESFNEAMGAIYTRVYLQPELLTEPFARYGGEEAL